MAVLLGSICGTERSSRYLNPEIKKFIDSLNEKQLRKMRRSLASEMRLTIDKKDKQRLFFLEKEMDYIKYRLEIK